MYCTRTQIFIKPVELEWDSQEKVPHHCLIYVPLQSLVALVEFFINNTEQNLDLIYLV